MTTKELDQAIDKAVQSINYSYGGINKPLAKQALLCLCTRTEVNIKEFRKTL